MNMEEARLYCLKLERDRERSWRESRQGAFEASMLSLDEHVARSRRSPTEARMRRRCVRVARTCAPAWSIRR